MWQIVLVANVSKIRKPVFVALAEASQNLDGDIVKITKSSYISLGNVLFYPCFDFPLKLLKGCCLLDVGW